MKSNSQICTTKEQSERLLALGLKKETADMEIHSFKENDQEAFETGYANKGYMEPELAEIVDCFPAWSLHRLIELLPQWIDTTETSLKLTIDQGKLVCYRGIFDGVQTFVFGHTSLYDSIIDIIEKLIKEGYFNKEYLEE